MSPIIIIMPNNSGFSSFSSLDIQIMVLFLFRDSIKAETEKSNAHEQFFQTLYIFKHQKMKIYAFFGIIAGLLEAEQSQSVPD